MPTEKHLGTNCPVINKQITDDPIQIQNPHGKLMESTHIGKLDLPLRGPAALRAHTEPALKDCCLLSMGSICDTGYADDFNANGMRILDDRKCMLTGHQ
jgi:hypothetical protein